MFRMAWTKVSNLKKKEYDTLADAVYAAVKAQLSAKVYNNRKVVATVDENGVRYY